MNKVFKKPSEMLCGSACLYFLQKRFFQSDKSPIKKNLSWITEIAEYVINHFDKNALVSCHDSNLYNDFLNASEEEIQRFIGFKKLNRFTQKGNQIIDFEVTKESVDSLLETNHLIIMNVSSALFNQDEHMTGGHFIVVLNIEGDNYLVVNPGKNNIYIEQYTKERIINSCKKFGGWMITIQSNKKPALS